LPEPSGDLLIFHTALPGVRFAARPSGTEPKIKFYLFARTEVKGPAQLAEAKSETSRRLDQMSQDIEQYVTGVLVMPSGERRAGTLGRRIATGSHRTPLLPRHRDGSDPVRLSC